MKTKYWLPLTLVIVFGLIIRLINFGSNPSSLYWDEVAIGLDARSLIQTGRDINGNQWLQPLFKSYGDYKAPVYILATTILAKFLGFSETIIRLPSLLAFIGLSISLFFLVKLIFPTKKLMPLLSVFTLSIMPWSYHFSRIGMESHLSLFFLTASIYLLIKGLTDKKILIIIISALTLSLGIYSYIVLRIIGPILFLITFFLYKSKDQKLNLKIIIINLIIIATSITVLTKSNFYQQSQNYRLSNDNLLTSTTNINSSIKSIEATSNSIINRAIYHRYFYKAKEYTSNYFEYFSPKFLLTKGDPNLRHHSGYGGELLLIQGLFLIIGLFYLNTINLKPKLLLISWIILSPSIAALVNETPHASRAIYLMVPLTILIALGINQSIKLTKSKHLLSPLILLLILIINSSLFLYDYHKFYPDRSKLDWIQPYTKIFKHFKNNPSPKSIYITSKYYQPGLYARFYLSNYDTFSFNLPDTCPSDAICISTENWESIINN